MKIELNYENGKRRRVFIGDCPDLKKEKFTGYTYLYDGKEEITTYYVNGKEHREDGPAYIDERDGIVVYYIHGEKIACQNNEQFRLYVDLMKLKNLSVTTSQ